MLSSLNGNSRMKKWYDYHNERRPGLWRPELLEGFLCSTVDEVRSRRANELAQVTLKLHYFDEVMPLRESVLCREAGGDTANPNQRDHTAHTVNNWLLGWLIYENSKQFRTAFGKA